MKPILTLLTLLTTTMLLCGCPFSSAYKLDDGPHQPIDEALIGKWATLMKKPNKEKEEPVKLSIAKMNDMEYSFSISGFIDEMRPYKIITEDSIKGTAFLSTAANRQFLNLLIKDRVYIVEIKNERGSISFLPLAENFTAKMLKNCAALRTAIEYHYKTRVRPMYDDDFCLMEMVKVK